MEVSPDLVPDLVIIWHSKRWGEFQSGALNLTGGETYPGVASWEHWSHLKMIHLQSVPPLSVTDSEHHWPMIRLAPLMSLSLKKICAGKGGGVGRGDPGCWRGQLIASLCQVHVEPEIKRWDTSSNFIWMKVEIGKKTAGDSPQRREGWSVATAPASGTGSP